MRGNIDTKKWSSKRQYHSRNGSCCSWWKYNVNKLAKLIADGRVVIPKNINGHSKACGIGDGLKTKINANIGSSSKIDDIELEVNKAKLAQEYGADALMDLSTGSDLTTFRKKISKITIKFNRGPFR